MTIEPSWRMGMTENEALDIGMFGALTLLETRQVLVPDTRLQAIADAWGNDDLPPAQYHTRDWIRNHWPELAVQLDAPAKENN